MGKLHIPDLKGFHIDGVLPWRATMENKKRFGGRNAASIANLGQYV